MDFDSTTQLPTKFLNKLSEVISVDPSDIVKDAKSKGLPIAKIEDFTTEIICKNYRRIEDISSSYGNYAARNSAVTGLASGIGGVATMVTIGGVDIVNMAAQLYRLNQRVAYLNGFDPNNPHDAELAREIYLFSLGFDKAAVAGVQAMMNRAAQIAGKSGAKSNPVLKLIMIVASKLAPKMTTKQAAKFIPVVGGILGGGINFAFAKYASSEIQKRYKEEFFRKMQTESINS